MIWPRKRLKKAPLPFSFWNLDSEGKKLARIMMDKFEDMFGERTNISNQERITWGEYLSDLGICWDIRVSKMPNWDGWEVFSGVACHMARPKGLEDHIEVGRYYVPRELALKMLVLDGMP